MSYALNRVAEEVAAEEWQRKWGSGIHLLSPAIQAKAQKAALTEIEKWYKLLKPVFEAEENARIRAVDAKLAPEIEDNWGWQGDGASQFLVDQILDRNGNLPD